MVLMELLRQRKGPQHVQSYFKSYFWHLNELLQLLNPSLYFYLTTNFASPRHDQLIILIVMIAPNCILPYLIVSSFSLSQLICYYSSQLSSYSLVSLLWLSNISHVISEISLRLSFSLFSSPSPCHNLRCISPYLSTSL